MNGLSRHLQWTFTDLRGEKTKQKTYRSFFDYLVVDTPCAFFTLVCLCWKQCDDHNQMGVAGSGRLLGTLAVSGRQRLVL